MLSWLALCLSAPPALAEDVAESAAASEGSGGPIDAALQLPKKGRWDPKGKAIDPFGRGDAKRKQEAWQEAIPLLVSSLERQPGCGKCLSSLAQALTGAGRYEDAVRVGEALNALYPERKEGWQRISDNWTRARRLPEAIEATSKYLELAKDDSVMWWRRNQLLVQLARFDEAEGWLSGAEAAGLSKEDLACLKVQVLAAKGDPVAARDLWSSCDLGDDADLKKYTEGWLALAEGDEELALKRLSMSGDDDFARLIVSFIRIDEGRFDMANNLVSRLFPTHDWALDARLAHAEALHGLDKDQEALAVLRGSLMGEGWAEAHRSLSVDQVLLKPKGEAWAKEIGERAVRTELEILAETDPKGAHALYLEALGIYGPSEELKKAAKESATFTGPAGAPVDAAYQATLEAAIQQSLPKLQGCIDAERKKTPTLGGRIVPRITVGASGAVTEPSLVDTDLGNPAAEACVVKQLAALKLPAPPAPPVVVIWPIEFARP